MDVLSLPIGFPAAHGGPGRVPLPNQRTRLLAIAVHVSVRAGCGPPHPHLHAGGHPRDRSVAVAFIASPAAFSAPSSRKRSSPTLQLGRAPAAGCLCLGAMDQSCAQPEPPGGGSVPSPSGRVFRSEEHTFEL